LFTTIEASFFLRIHKNSCQECSPSQTDFIKITRQEQYFRYPNFWSIFSSRCRMPLSYFLTQCILRMSKILQIGTLTFSTVSLFVSFCSYFSLSLSLPLTSYTHTHTISLSHFLTIFIFSLSLTIFISLSLSLSLSPTSLSFTHTLTHSLSRYLYLSLSGIIISCF